MNSSIESLFTSSEVESLRAHPNLTALNRRTLCKWRSVLSSQTIAGGGTITLITDRMPLTHDPFKNVAKWNKTKCGFCSCGCGLEIGINQEGQAVVVRGNGKHPTNPNCVCVKSLCEQKSPDNPDHSDDNHCDTIKPALGKSSH